MRLGDHEYFSRRLAEESAAALTTPCPFAQRVHLELASLYSGKLRLMDALCADAPCDSDLDVLRKDVSRVPAGRAASR